MAQVQEFHRPRGTHCLPPPLRQTQGTSSPALFYSCALRSLQLETIPASSREPALEPGTWRRTGHSVEEEERVHAEGRLQARRQLSGRRFSPCTIWHPGTGLGLSDLVVSTSELLLDSLGSVRTTHPSLPSILGQPRGDSAKPSHPNSHAELFPKLCPFVLAVPRHILGM